MPNSYQKHLIKCSCILSTYKNKKDPVFHRIVAFSEIDEEGEVIPSFTLCTNCGALHKVKEICKSEIIYTKDNVTSLPKLEEIKLSIPQKILDICSSYDVDLSTWQELKFIIENELWGSRVILTREDVDSSLTGKALLIFGPDTLKIESYTTNTALEKP